MATQTFPGCIAAIALLFASLTPMSAIAQPADGRRSDPALTVAQTRAIVEPYLREHDASRLAPGAVFIDMSSGTRHEGREAIAHMLQFIYHTAFDARFEMRHLVVGEGLASIEGDFVGRHIGEFAGVPATGRDVRVPLSVTYVVGPEGITEGRIYMLGSVMMAQLGTSPANR